MRETDNPGPENYINWEVVGKDRSFLGILTREIANLNFPERQKAVSEESRKAAEQGRKANFPKPGPEEQDLIDNLNLLSSLDEIRSYCENPNNKVKFFPDTKGLESLAKTHLDMIGIEQNADDSQRH